MGGPGRNPFFCLKPLVATVSINQWMLAITSAKSVLKGSTSGMPPEQELYVTLSRSLGRSTIRLLRDFDEKLFQSSHDTQLLDEDDRLDRLDQITKDRWTEMTKGED